MSIIRNTIRTNDLPAAAEPTTGGLDKLIVIAEGKNKLITLNDLFAKIKSSLTINPDFGAIGLKVNGQTKADLLNVSPTLDKVGIGTDAPTALLHVMGDVNVGGTGAGQNGTFCLSNEVLTVAEGATVLTTHNSYTISNIKTVELSPTTVTIEVPAPTKVNQVKTVMVSDCHFDKSSNLNYTVSKVNIIGINSLKLTKLGDSISLISVQSSGVYKWVVTSVVGATIT